MDKETEDAIQRVKDMLTPERYEELSTSLDLLFDILLDDYFNQFYVSGEEMDSIKL